MFSEEQVTTNTLPELEVKYFDIILNDKNEIVALYIDQPEEERPLKIDDPGCVMVADFAESERLPFFLIRCGDECWEIRPANRLAHAILFETVVLDRSGWAHLVRLCMAAHDSLLC